VKRSDSKRSYSIEVQGAKRQPLEDAYHWFLMASWSRVLFVVTLAYFALNALFASGYLVTGGVRNLESRSFAAAFFFSVQTFGTIGYGAQFPVAGLANSLVTLESLTSLLFTALVTGLVFAKFSRPRGRLVFADRAVLTPFQGVPTLLVRLGNERGNRVVEANIHIDLSLSETLEDGSTFYRQHSLRLVRKRLAALVRTWNVMHVVDATSPLFGLTGALLEKLEAEIIVSVNGLDDTSGQTMHGQVVYEAHEIVFGAKLSDVLSSDASGNLVLDLSRFDDIEPSEPTEAFPHSWQPPKRW
jgi:inward rectifier potassium channel